MRKRSRAGTALPAPSSCSLELPPPVCPSACRALSSTRRCAPQRLGKGRCGVLRVSINLLADDIGEEGYVDWLLDEVRAVGIDPKRVTIEITEHALLSDLDAVGGRLERLREAGFKVALDDFGTGYASLAYLGSLPLDALKIDRGLIAKIGTSERDRIVVRSIFGLARELGLTVIVEGVESTAQLVLLAEWGCDLYQGFLGAGALDEMELSRFVAVSQNSAA